MELSVVVPVLNEAENIPGLVGEIRAALDGKLSYEIVYVDDGSTDQSVAVLRHGARCGQSAAIRTGVKAARASWIATLDGDGQNDPADIPLLWAARAALGGDALVLIAGHRQKRRDSWSKRVASRIANRVRGNLLADDTPDSGCGLKLFPRALFLDLPYFDHMHRFLGALVIRAGGRVRSVPVNHRPRTRGASKYGVLDRLWVGISDLLGVMWLRRRSHRPVVEEG
jgi:dolichol-phosphate mannosyltransferase